MLVVGGIFTPGGKGGNIQGGADMEGLGSEVNVDKLIAMQLKQVKDGCD